jgi:hypothetical protein
MAQDIETGRASPPTCCEPEEILLELHDDRECIPAHQCPGNDDAGSAQDCGIYHALIAAWEHGRQHGAETTRVQEAEPTMNESKNVTAKVDEVWGDGRGLTVVINLIGEELAQFKVLASARNERAPDPAGWVAHADSVIERAVLSGLKWLAMIEPDLEKLLESAKS